MTSITRDYFDAIDVPAGELAEAAARAGVPLDEARDSIDVIDAWHQMKTERGEMQRMPLDVAMRHADCGGLSDAEVRDMAAELAELPYIIAPGP